MAQLEVVPRQRLSDVAFARLKAAIIRAEISSTDRIRDAELAQRLGLSRTPVREALNRLVEIGLVESKPGSYTRVVPLTKQNVMMTLAVLEPLDELAVRTSVPNLAAREITELRRLNRDFSEAIRSGDLTAAIVADQDFHRSVRESSQNPVLMRVIAQLDPQVQRIVYRKFSTLMGSQDTVHHHDQLIEMCERGDAQAAAQFSASQWRLLGGQVHDLFDSE
ncbi:GntR family transcriptional regulator [Microtetraspora malaysiensis]|uniref:GntR family transcriptional regulator n=1 Tax=Microtetraspora malaysiensis TaxID=161358 RepID=UPI003D8D8931